MTMKAHSKGKWKTSASVFVRHGRTQSVELAFKALGTRCNAEAAREERQREKDEG